jgi:multisubunit Na+/H+ antiporter MnhB subunit
MHRDWFAIIVVIVEIAVGLAASAGVYAAFHSY